MGAQALSTRRSDTTQITQRAGAQTQMSETRAPIWAGVHRIGSADTCNSIYGEAP